MLRLPLAARTGVPPGGRRTLAVVVAVLENGLEKFTFRSPSQWPAPLGAQMAVAFRDRVAWCCVECEVRQGLVVASPVSAPPARLLSVSMLGVGACQDFRQAADLEL